MRCRVFCVAAPILLGLAAGGLWGLHAADVDLPVSPLTPAQSIKTMQIDPALSVELVACEPMVQDPVAICWDAQGAMYVAEMGDYPALPTGGRIKRLVDTNGDGRMDKVTTFAADIAYPTSVLPYRDGILVCTAPDIVWLRDTDGDGVADQRQRLLTGFGEGNQQLRVNGLAWGLDHWIYGANGRSDGEIGFVGPNGVKAGTPVAIRSTDFRFQPDERVVETAGGFTQFGQSFDDFGQRFISWNTVHIRHVVMEQRYLGLNPHAPVTATTQELSDAGSTPRLFPISQTTQRFNAEAPGFFNASCGLTIFRGDALGADYRGNAFACEPLSNIVHRDRLRGEGASFIASRPEQEQEREFLASTDTWFRPVNLATGPDGSLHVVDFYRKWIEHPQWVANEEARKTVNWAEGKEYGRIYRIVPKSRPALVAHPRNLAALASADLVPLLAHPNAWQRETAQRLLLERKAVEFEPAIRNLLKLQTEPAGRIHALATLSGLRKLSTAALTQGLKDPVSPVRRVAVQFAETKLDQPDILSAVLALSRDADPQVRFQVVCSLGFAKHSDQITAALAERFAQDGNDPWMREALFLAGSGQVPQVIRQLIEQRLDIEKLSVDQLHWLLQVIASEAHDASPWTELRSAFKANAPWMRLLALGLSKQQHTETWFVDVIASANALAVDEAARANDRLIAIGLLKYVNPDVSLPSLEKLLSAEQSPEIQQRAAETAGEIATPAAAQMQIQAIAKTSPAVRRTLLDGLIGRRDQAPLLAQAIAAGKVPVHELDGSQRASLLSRLDKPTQESLADKLTPVRTAARAEVIEKYLGAVNATQDVQAGRQTFQRLCRACHLRQGDGTRVGPDLTGIAGRSPQDLLIDIIDPNRSVSVDGRCFTLLTRDGLVKTGVIAGETASSVTIKKAGGTLDSVLRSDIEELKFTGKSLMPEGFEQFLTPEDLANLIAFLKDSKTK